MRTQPTSGPRASCSFAPGAAIANYTTIITNDLAAEGNEIFDVKLSVPTAGTLGMQRKAAVTIIDND